MMVLRWCPLMSGVAVLRSSLLLYYCFSLLLSCAELSLAYTEVEETATQHIFTPPDRSTSITPAKSDKSQHSSDDDLFKHSSSYTSLDGADGADNNDGGVAPTRPKLRRRQSNPLDVMLDTISAGTGDD